MNVARKKSGKYSFYFLIGMLGLLAVLLGFLTTYITPSIRGTFKAPFVVHVHGAFAFGWILLFLVQTVVVKFRNFSLHKTLGYFGVIVATGVIVTMLPVGLFQVERDLANGLGYTAVSQIVGIVTTAAMFGALVSLGYLYRKKPKVHKRILLLATIVLLWPAWFRFRHYFPNVPRPDIWFAVVLADSLIVLSWIVDKATYDKIHPALLYGGLFIVAEHVFEVVMFDSEPWRRLAKAIYSAVIY